MKLCNREYVCSSSAGGSRKARGRKFNKRRVQFEQQRKVKEDLYEARSDADDDEEQNNENAMNKEDFGGDPQVDWES